MENVNDGFLMICYCGGSIGIMFILLGVMMVYANLTSAGNVRNSPCK